jgi:hypothetical protein
MPGPSTATGTDVKVLEASATEGKPAGGTEGKLASAREGKPAGGTEGKAAEGTAG